MEALGGIELATVGNLLVVGTDSPESTRASDVRLALVTSAPEDIPFTVPLGPPAGHRLVQLEDGSVAEVWDSAVGFHDTPAAPARGTAGTDVA